MAVLNECIMIITDYITLENYVLLTFQLDTIKLLEVKKLQDLNYIKRTQGM